MSPQKKQRQYYLPIRLSPYRDEGPQGYLSRLSENNLLTQDELRTIGMFYDYDLMVSQDILVSEAIDTDLHRKIAYISALWQNNVRVWNTQFARFCPHCLSEHEYWRLEWELNFYDVCHRHKVWMIDQCTTCGEGVTWNRAQLNRCRCGSIFNAEQSKPCPESMVEIAKAMSCKVLQKENSYSFPLVLHKTDVEETQRLIRYLGNYMSLASGKNPLKMRQAGSLTNSWPVTSLAAEVMMDWPSAFHHALTQLEKQNRRDGRPSFNEVFGQAYHYVFKGLKGKAFEELRRQFELWINAAWKGGIAKRNKRLTSTLMKQATWVPATVACDFLGVSYQRVELLIREGTLEGETHISEKGRKFVMVRRDNLDQVKGHLFGLIDMTTAGRLLGLQKRRMRQLLTLIFPEAKKLGTSSGSPWSVSRLQVNNIIDIGLHVDVVSIPDESCVSLGHILRYWAWTNQEIANLIHSVRTGEIKPVNRLETMAGISALVFKEVELKNWKLKTQNGTGAWLTISQAAKVIGIKEQVAYELVKRGYLKDEIMPLQMKRGTRIKRIEVEKFCEEYVFATKISEKMGCSPRKVINNLSEMGINPISGPMVDGMRQVLYLKSLAIEEFL